MLHLAGPAKGPLAHAMRAVALVCALLLSLGSVSLAGPGHSGDEGHSHDASQAASSQSPRVVATSEAFQLVGILKNDLLTIYLDREQDNSPVLDATVEVSADGKTVVADATSDGTYTLPAVAVAKPGENVLEFSIKDGQTFDLLGGTLLVPGEKSDHAAHDPTSPLGWLDRPIPAGWAAVAGVVVLVTGSLIGGLFARRAMLAHILVLFASGALLFGDPASAGPGHSGDEGHAHGPGSADGASDSPRRLSDGSVFLPKPTQRLIEVRSRYVGPETVRRAIRMPGRVISNPNHTAIVQSTVDGRITPFNGKFAQVGQKVRAGEVLGYVQPVMSEIDRSDFEQTAGQLDQEIALAKNRLEQFRKFSTFPAERIRTAEIEVANLERRRAAMAQRKRGNEPLTAPIDGVIATAQAVIGQVVSPKDVLFQIVEPRSPWIEALAYETVDVDQLGAARAVVNNLPPENLQFVSRSPSLAQHATAIKFQAADPSRLDIGRQVTVLAETGKPMSGIVIPRAAVVQAPNGEFVVFRHIEPERFEPKPVQFVDVDGERVLLTAGIEAGEKIAVQSAALINQIR